MKNSTEVRANYNEHSFFHPSYWFIAVGFFLAVWNVNFSLEQDVARYTSNLDEYFGTSALEDGALGEKGPFYLFALVSYR